MLRLNPPGNCRGVIAALLIPVLLLSASISVTCAADFGTFRSPKSAAPSAVQGHLRESWAFAGRVPGVGHVSHSHDVTILNTTLLLDDWAVLLQSATCTAMPHGHARTATLSPPPLLPGENEALLQRLPVVLSVLFREGESADSFLHRSSRSHHVMAGRDFLDVVPQCLPYLWGSTFSLRSLRADTAAALAGFVEVRLVLSPAPWLAGFASARWSTSVQQESASATPTPNNRSAADSAAEPPAPGSRHRGLETWYLLNDGLNWANGGIVQPLLPISNLTAGPFYAAASCANCYAYLTSTLTAELDFCAWALLDVRTPRVCLFGACIPSVYFGTVGVGPLGVGCARSDGASGGAGFHLALSVLHSASAGFGVGIEVDANVSGTLLSLPSTQLLASPVFSFTFFVVGLPVNVGINLALNASLTAAGTVSGVVRTGTLTLSGSISHGFEYDSMSSLGGPQLLQNVSLLPLSLPSPSASLTFGSASVRAEITPVVSLTLYGFIHIDGGFPVRVQADFGYVAPDAVLCDLPLCDIPGEGRDAGGALKGVYITWQLRLLVLLKAVRLRDIVGAVPGVGGLLSGLVGNNNFLLFPGATLANDAITARNLIFATCAVGEFSWGAPAGQLRRRQRVLDADDNDEAAEQGVSGDGDYDGGDVPPFQLEVEHGRSTQLDSNLGGRREQYSTPGVVVTAASGSSDRTFPPSASCMTTPPTASSSPPSSGAISGGTTAASPHSVVILDSDTPTPPMATSPTFPLLQQQQQRLHLIDTAPDTSHRGRSLQASYPTCGQYYNGPNNVGYGNGAWSGTICVPGCLGLLGIGGASCAATYTLSCYPGRALAGASSYYSTCTGTETAGLFGCNAETFVFDGRAYCAVCGPGLLCTGSQAPPQTCNPGYYCMNGMQTACPCGGYCPAGVSAPITCPAGSFCPAQASAPIQCVVGTCPSGSCSALSNSPSSTAASTYSASVTGTVSSTSAPTPSVTQSQGATPPSTKSPSSTLSPTGTSSNTGTSTSTPSSTRLSSAYPSCNRSPVDEGAPYVPPGARSLLTDSRSQSSGGSAPSRLLSDGARALSEPAPVAAALSLVTTLQTYVSIAGMATPSDASELARISAAGYAAVCGVIFCGAGVPGFFISVEAQPANGITSSSSSSSTSGVGVGLVFDVQWSVTAVITSGPLSAPSASALSADDNATFADALYFASIQGAAAAAALTMMITEVGGDPSSTPMLNCSTAGSNATLSSALGCFSTAGVVPFRFMAALSAINPALGGESIPGNATANLTSPVVTANYSSALVFFSANATPPLPLYVMTPSVGPSASASASSTARASTSMLPSTIATQGTSASPSPTISVSPTGMASAPASAVGAVASAAGATFNVAAVAGGIAAAAVMLLIAVAVAIIVLRRRDKGGGRVDAGSRGDAPRVLAASSPQDALETAPSRRSVSKHVPDHDELLPRYNPMHGTSTSAISTPALALGSQSGRDSGNRTIASQPSVRRLYQPGAVRQ